MPREYNGTTKQGQNGDRAEVITINMAKELTDGKREGIE